MNAARSQRQLLRLPHRRRSEEEKGGKVRQTNGDLSLTLQGELYSTHTCRETSLNSVCVCV